MRWRRRGRSVRHAPVEAPAADDKATDAPPGTQREQQDDIESTARQTDATPAAELDQAASVRVEGAAGSDGGEGDQVASVRSEGAAGSGRDEGVRVGGADQGGGDEGVRVAGAGEGGGDEGVRVGGAGEGGRDEGDWGEGEESELPSVGAARELVVATLRRVRALVGLTGWALVGALPTLASGQAVARAVDDGFLAGRTGTGLAWLGGLAATVPLGALGARRTYLGVAKMVEPLRDDLVTRVVEGALRSSTGDGAVSGHAAAVARLTQHVEIVRDTVAGLLLLLLGFLAAVVAALVGLVTLVPAVLPLVVVPLVLAFGAFTLSLPEVARRQRRVLLAEERVAELAGATAGGLRDIVASGGEDTMRAVLDDAIAEQVAAGKALARVAALRTVIVAVGGRVPLLLVLAASGWLLDRGLSAGALLGSLTYLLQGLGPAVSSVVGGVGIPLAQLLVTVDRIDATVAVGAPPAGTARPDGDGLELRGVTFRYRTAAEPVIAGLDLDVAPGEHLAVVGPSGAGKSTLAALLVGLLAPQAGTIRHGGRPAHEVAPEHRVLIPQQAYVFRGTVDENVRYLHRSATPAERDRAIEAVGLRPLVERLGGPDAEVDPGRLSAGERQLVSLARAYLAQAGLLVLDEATCHLDPVAEARVEEAFAARGDTLIVIAHRITSAERADRILLLDGVEALVGTQVDLVDRSPLYRDLVGHWLDTAEAPA